MAPFFLLWDVLPESSYPEKILKCIKVYHCRVDLWLSNAACAIGEVTV